VLEKNREVLRRGNRIIMLHTVDRQPMQLLYSITQWLPLHLTGKTIAYYYPEYSNSIFKPSISLIRNHAVMTGMTVDGYSETLFTYYSSDPNLVKHFEILFRGLLAVCHPLYERECGNITQKLLESAARHEPSYSFSPLPLTLALDIATFSEVLRENGISGEKYGQSVDFFQKQKALLTALEKCAMYQILNLSMLERGVTEGIRSSELNWIIGSNLFVSAEYCSGDCKA
jgi:hypothetical protein